MYRGIESENNNIEMEEISKSNCDHWILGNPSLKPSNTSRDKEDAKFICTKCSKIIHIKSSSEKEIQDACNIINHTIDDIKNSSREEFNLALDKYFNISIGMDSDIVMMEYLSLLQYSVRNIMIPMSKNTDIKMLQESCFIIDRIVDMIKLSIAYYLPSEIQSKTQGVDCFDTIKNVVNNVPRLYQLITKKPRRKENPIEQLWKGIEII